MSNINNSEFMLGMNNFSMSFEKWHGLGNNFIICDIRLEEMERMQFIKNNITDIVIKMSNIKTGLGCDQFVLIDNLHSSGGKLKDNDIPLVRFFNNDGSESGSCGNATRCVAMMIFRNRHYANKLTGDEDIRLGRTGGSRQNKENLSEDVEGIRLGRTGASEKDMASLNSGGDTEVIHYKDEENLIKISTRGNGIIDCKILYDGKNNPKERRPCLGNNLPVRARIGVIEEFTKLERGGGNNQEFIKFDESIFNDIDDLLKDFGITFEDKITSDIFYVNVGNPHLVVSLNFTKEENVQNGCSREMLDKFDKMNIETKSKIIQSKFVDTFGINIEFCVPFKAQSNGDSPSLCPNTPDDALNFYERTYERGAGETNACGTGASAVGLSQFLLHDRCLTKVFVRGVRNYADSIEIFIESKKDTNAQNLKNPELFMTGSTEFSASGVFVV